MSGLLKDSFLSLQEDVSRLSIPDTLQQLNEA